MFWQAGARVGNLALTFVFVSVCSWDVLACTALRPWLSGDHGNQIIGAVWAVLSEWDEDSEWLEENRENLLRDFRLEDQEVDSNFLRDTMMGLKFLYRRPPRVLPLNRTALVCLVTCSDTRI